MRKVSGFTLFELLTVVAIVAILAAVAVPGTRALVTSTRVSGLATELQNSLAFARSTAITQRHVTVWMRTTAPDGWQVRRDSNTGLVLAEYRVTSASAGFAILPTATPTTTLTEVRFDPSGLVRRHDSGVATDIEFRVCSPDTRKEEGRSIRISRLGRLVGIRHASPAICNP